MTWFLCDSPYKAQKLSSLLLGTILAPCLLPASALAISIPESLDTAASSPLACSGQTIESPASADAGEGFGLAKSAAILGGQPSALDLIRQQQSDLDSAAEPILLAAPVLHATIAAPAHCLASFGWIDGFAKTEAVAPNPVEHFLNSPRVGIRVTPFNDDWQRVSAPQLSSSRAESLIGLTNADPVATLAQVNSWANRRIEFTDDRTSSGTRDHWATAEETLAVGVGDCEDYAILKYQILSALGFDRSQMYLTLARDLVRNADHAVLVVRIGEQDYLLDSATDALLPADTSHDYRPTMSFNSESAWLHGYTQRSRTAPTTQPGAFAYLSDNALSSALVTGRSR